MTARALRVTDVPSPELAIWMDEMFGGRIDVIAVDTDGLPNTVHKGGGSVALRLALETG